MDPNFKPLSLNVRKALEIVKKFEMQWPALEQRKPLKFLGSGEVGGGMDEVVNAKGKTMSPKKVSNMNDEDGNGTRMPPLPTGTNAGATRGRGH